MFKQSRSHKPKENYENDWDICVFKTLPSYSLGVNLLRKKYVFGTPQDF